MQGSSAVNSETFKVTTPSETEITMTRLFDAPRKLVFEAMTKPEHVKQWWGRLGEGYSVPVCEIDLRVGGKWRFVNRFPEGEAAFHGEYREITPPSRLVFTEIFEEYPDRSSSASRALYSCASACAFTKSWRRGGNLESRIPRDDVPKGLPVS